MNIEEYREYRKSVLREYGYTFPEDEQGILEAQLVKYFTDRGLPQILIKSRIRKLFEPWDKEKAVQSCLK